MIDIDVRMDIKGLTRRLSNLEKKQIPFATSLALNWTANEARDSARKSLEHVFDRPTRYVRNSLRAKMSTKKKLMSQVGYRLFGGTPAEHIVGPHVTGGERGPTRTEIHLRRAGLISNDEFLVAGNKMKRNRYGNIAQGWWVKALSGLQAHPDQISRSKGKKSAQWFMSKVRGKKVIFYRKSRNNLVIAFVVVKRPKYKKRFHLDRIVKKVVDRRFNKNFEKAFTQAMRTAH